MKNGTLIGAVIALGIVSMVGVLAVSAKAGMWEKLTTMGTKTVPSTNFNVEAAGWNLRAYVFQTPDKSKTCMFVAGSKKGGLACWDSK